MDLPSSPRNKYPPNRRPATLRLSRWASCFGVVLALTLTGCSTPGSRARQRPAAFTALSRADQRLVLRGKVREGLGKDAVYIAWGQPDEKVAADSKGAPFEYWLYFMRWSVYAPLHSYADTPYAGSLFAARYERNVVFSAVRGKKAVFVDGKLQSSQVWWQNY